MLEEFVREHRYKTGPELEKMYGNSASLLLTRMTSMLRVTYEIGFAVAIQLEAILVFMNASAGTQFVAEFVEVGGIELVLDCLQQPTLTDSDRLSALRLLTVVSNLARSYRELFCAQEGVSCVLKGLQFCKSNDTLNASRVLVLSVMAANSQHLEPTLMQLTEHLYLPNPGAQRVVVQAIRALLPAVNCDMDFPNEDLVNASYYALLSPDIEVQHASSEVIMNLLEFRDVHYSLFEAFMISPENVLSMDEDASEEGSMLADLSTDARELVDSVRLDVLTNTYRTVLQLYSDRLPTLDERNPGGGELFPFMTRSISKYEEKSGRIVDCLKAMHAVWPSRNNVSSFGGTAGAESEEDEFNAIANLIDEGVARELEPPPVAHDAGFVTEGKSL